MSNETQIEEIKIFWNGPFSIQEIVENKIVKQKYRIDANDVGLYQIYGSHPLYGHNVLVYIGRTKNEHGFKRRLKDRWVVEVGADANNIQVYLGVIYSDTKKYNYKEKEKKIDKAEALLINALKPAYNSSNIQSVKESFFENRFIVHNTDNYRGLNPILDSQYFWNVHKNIALVNKLASIFHITPDNREEYYGFEINNKYFKNLPDQYSIWMGVDHEIWDLKGIPFVIEVYSEDEKIYPKFKSLKGYEQEDSRKIFFKAKDVSLLDSINLEEEFVEEIKTIINSVKL